MANLIPIGLKIGLPITLDRNDGQNKLEGCISKNMAKKWHKISRAATFGQSWNGHDVVILHPIWTFNPTIYHARAWLSREIWVAKYPPPKSSTRGEPHYIMISSSRRIDW